MMGSNVNDQHDVPLQKPLQQPLQQPFPPSSNEQASPSLSNSGPSPSTRHIDPRLLPRPPGPRASSIRDDEADEGMAALRAAVHSRRNVMSDNPAMHLNPRSTSNLFDKPSQPTESPYGSQKPPPFDRRQWANQYPPQGPHQSNSTFNMGSQRNVRFKPLSTPVSQEQPQQQFMGARSASVPSFAGGYGGANAGFGNMGHNPPSDRNSQFKRNRSLMDLQRPNPSSPGFMTSPNPQHPMAPRTTYGMMDPRRHPMGQSQPNLRMSVTPQSQLPQMGHINPSERAFIYNSTQHSAVPSTDVGRMSIVPPQQPMFEHSNGLTNRSNPSNSFTNNNNIPPNRGSAFHLARDTSFRSHTSGKPSSNGSAYGGSVQKNPDQAHLDYKRKVFSKFLLGMLTLLSVFVGVVIFLLVYVFPSNDLSMEDVGIQEKMNTAVGSDVAPAPLTNAEMSTDIITAPLATTDTPMVRRQKGITAVLSKYSGSSPFVDETTPQSRALNWILHDDEQRLNIPSPNDDIETYLLLQRFAMATIFFSTNGEKWSSQLLFLSKKSCCEWHHIDQEGFFSGSGRCDDFGRVTMLALWENNLVGNLPLELGYLTSLKVLSLYGNELGGQVPQTFVNLQNLGTLYLHKNKIEGDFDFMCDTEINNLRADCFTSTVTCSCCSVCCDAQGACYQQN